MQNQETEPVGVTRSCTKVQREAKFFDNKKAIKIKICDSKFSPWKIKNKSFFLLFCVLRHLSHYCGNFWNMRPTSPGPM